MIISGHHHLTHAWHRQRIFRLRLSGQRPSQLQEWRQRQGACEAPTPCLSLTQKLHCKLLAKGTFGVAQLVSIVLHTKKSREHFTCQGPQDLASTHATSCCNQGSVVLCVVMPHGAQLHGVHEMTTPSVEALPVLLVQSKPAAVQPRTLWSQGGLQGWAVAVHPCCVQTNRQQLHPIVSMLWTRVAPTYIIPDRGFLEPGSQEAVQAALDNGKPGMQDSAQNASFACSSDHQESVDTLVCRCSASRLPAQSGKAVGRCAPQPQLPVWARRLASERLTINRSQSPFYSAYQTNISPLPSRLHRDKPTKLFPVEPYRPSAPDADGILLMKQEGASSNGGGLRRGALPCCVLLCACLYVHALFCAFSACRLTAVSITSCNICGCDTVRPATLAQVTLAALLGNASHTYMR